MRKKLKISDENLLMIVLAFLSLSVGIWANYRQLWLENNGFDFTGISKIFSVALICSAIISFIISLFSYKIKVKYVTLLSLVFRTIAMIVIFFYRDPFIIKTGILLGIMCEVIFSISFYPMLTFVTKTNESYKKKTLIEYFSKDIGIVSCGLLIGVAIGKYTFDYDTCLMLAILTSFISSILLFLYKSNEYHSKKKPSSLISSLKRLLSNKINAIFLTNQMIIYIAYGIVFDLMMLILTNYINFEVSFASVFIIVCNMFGTIFSAILSKPSKKMSITVSTLIKYGIRAFCYILAYIFGSVHLLIVAVVTGYITARILEDKVTGSFVQLIDKEDQFLYGNLRYFAVCIGEGIGAFLAGVLISYSIRYLFLGAGIVTIVQTLVLIYLDKLKKG